MSGGEKALRHQKKLFIPQHSKKNEKKYSCHPEQPSLPCCLTDTKRAAAQRRPGPVAAYRRTPEREQTILIGWTFEIGGRQHDNCSSACPVLDSKMHSPSAKPNSCKRQELILAASLPCSRTFANVLPNYAARASDAARPASSLRARCCSCLLYTSPSPRD